MAKKIESIVMMEDYNGYKNVMFLTDEENIERAERLGMGKFTHVCYGKRVKVEKKFQRKSYVFQGENGKTYAIFSDFSAKEVTNVTL